MAVESISVWVRTYNGGIAEEPFEITYDTIYVAPLIHESKSLRVSELSYHVKRVILQPGAEVTHSSVA